MYQNVRDEHLDVEENDSWELHLRQVLQLTLLFHSTTYKSTVLSSSIKVFGDYSPIKITTTIKILSKFRTSIGIAIRVIL